jgi:S1-C subfamily serine protease
VLFDRRIRCGFAFVAIVGCLFPSFDLKGQQTVARRFALPEMQDGAVPESVDDLRSMERHFQEVAKRVIPTTVAIRVESAHGSGVIIGPEGYILTAAHVAGAPNREAMIRLHDGQRFRGVTLGVFRTLDAGLIKINSDNDSWPHANMGSSEDLAKGQWCLATGHPGGFQHGRPPVLRAGRILDTEANAITTDCKLIGGDSGGPLFDMQGKVIGIHSRIGEAFTANLHVPVDTYRETWDRLASGDAWGRLPGTGSPADPVRSKPFIGVQGKAGDRRARVSRVFQGSPAALAGIKVDDVITRFAASTVSDFDSLIELVKQQQPGSVVTVQVLRDGTLRHLELRIGLDTRRGRPQQ